MRELSVEEKKWIEGIPVMKKLVEDYLKIFPGRENEVEVLSAMGMVDQERGIVILKASIAVKKRIRINYPPGVIDGGEVVLEK